MYVKRQRSKVEGLNYIQKPQSHRYVNIQTSIKEIVR